MAAHVSSADDSNASTDSRRDDRAKLEGAGAAKRVLSMQDHNQLSLVMPTQPPPPHL